jgi:Secretin and TonB N terminus short domain
MAVARGNVAWIGVLTCLSFQCLGTERFPLPVAPAASHVTDEQVRFDIPAQPLVTALRAYGEATGVAVLFDDPLIQGRQSPGVRGIFNPADALRELLAGTGLRAQYAAHGGFTVVPDAKPGAEATLSFAAPPAGNDNDDTPSFVEEGYARELQARVTGALCQSTKTRPGTFRLAMQLWIADTGTVEKANLLDTTGDDSVDGAIASAVRGLRLSPPPLAMPQPVTLLLRPRAPGQADPCVAVSTREPA